MGKDFGTISGTSPRANEAAKRRVIRVRKEDSAFIYCVLEANEGIASYSTLPHQVGEAHRDLELWIPDGFASEVDELLKDLGDLIYELAPERT